MPEQLNTLIDVILPVFLVIGFGYAAARSGLMGEAAIDGIMRFAQNFAVPVLLFRSIGTLDLGAAFQPGLLVSFYAGAFASFAVAMAGALMLFRRPLPDAVAIGFAALFSNSLLLGLAITERAYGAAALQGNFAIIAIHSPLLYGFGITMMEWARARGRGLSALQVAAKALRAIATQPLVIGITLGLVVNLTGNPLPATVWSAVDMIARAAIPTALFGLGGVFIRYRLEGDRATIAMVCAASLLLHPGVSWLVGRYGFGLGTDALRSAVVTAAMAPGVNAYLFASMYGVAMRVAAASVLIATALSIVTIWGWLQILP